MNNGQESDSDSGPEWTGNKKPLNPLTASAAPAAAAGRGDLFTSAPPQGKGSERRDPVAQSAIEGQFHDQNSDLEGQLPNKPKIELGKKPNPIPRLAEQMKAVKLGPVAEIGIKK